MLNKNSTQDQKKKTDFKIRLRMLLCDAQKHNAEIMDLFFSIEKENRHIVMDLYFN